MTTKRILSVIVAEPDNKEFLHLATSGNFSEASFDSSAADVPAGPLHQLDSPRRSWSSWYMRLQFFFAVHDIDEPEKKKYYLQTLCGQ